MSGPLKPMWPVSESGGGVARRAREGGPREPGVEAGPGAPGAGGAEKQSRSPARPAPAPAASVPSRFPSRSLAPRLQLGSPSGESWGPGARSPSCAPETRVRVPPWCPRTLAQPVPLSDRPVCGAQAGAGCAEMGEG